MILKMIPSLEIWEQIWPNSLIIHRTDVDLLNQTGYQIFHDLKGKFDL